MRLPLVRLIERTLNLKPQQWLPCGWHHALGLQTYEITPCGALGGSETYENTAFGALRGCKPYGNAACGAHGAVLGIANTMGIQHAAPWGLTFPGHRRILLESTLARGANPTPRAPPRAVRIAHGAPHAHPRVRARFACTPAQRNANAVPAISAHRSEGVPIPPPRAPLPAVRNARRRQLRRFSKGSPIAGASGSPTAKLELRDDTRSKRARRSTRTLAGACAIRGHARAARARFACTLTWRTASAVPATCAHRSEGVPIPPPRAPPPAVRSARRRQLRRFSRGSPIAGASGSPTAKLESRDNTRAFRALLAPAAAQRRNSNPAATLRAFVHCSRQQEPNGDLARAPTAAAAAQR